MALLKKKKTFADWNGEQGKKFFFFFKPNYNAIDISCSMTIDLHFEPPKMLKGMVFKALLKM